MAKEIITAYQTKKRDYWVGEIAKLSGDFGADSEKVENELEKEISKDGLKSIVGHLRLCGSIPECYGHDSSEEKLYSKYTDIVLAKSFDYIGIKSLVLSERANVADVECISKNYSFVADAKAFRLSRTAKNQKDFKVQAMDNWKYGKPYAIVVSPVYQLPSRTSQIYQQAITRSVCVFSYTHLAVLVRYAANSNKTAAIKLLQKIFEIIETLNPSKDAKQYWASINGLILGHNSKIKKLWQEEKQASTESIILAKKESLSHLAKEREKLMMLSRDQAIKELIKLKKIDNREIQIKRISSNGLLDAK